MTQIPTEGLAVETPARERPFQSLGQIFVLVCAPNEDGLLEVPADSARDFFLQLLARIELCIHRADAFELSVINARGEKEERDF